MKNWSWVKLIRSSAFGLSCCLLLGKAIAQKKVEKETRIERVLVPQPALAFLDSLELGSCVKWYREENNDGISYEAKTNKRKNRHSIEFDKNGNIEDIEIVVATSRLPEKAIDEIKKFFENHYQTYSIRKIQLQYSGKEKDLLDFLLRKQKNQLVSIAYEIVAIVKKEEKQLTEFLFAENGDFIRSYVIELRETDNLEY